MVGDRVSRPFGGLRTRAEQGQIAAADAGFASALVLPLRTDRQPAGAVALYGPEPNVFRGAAHDIALFVAAQGGTAVHNARA